MFRPHRTLASLLLLVALLAGCSGGDHRAREGALRTTTTAATGKGSTNVTERKVLGTAAVEVGESSWTFDVTSCVVDDDRITAQGDDQSGSTVVASFAISSKAGSLTVARGNAAWSIGPAGGTKIAKAKITKDGISGQGGFTKRTFDTGDATGSKPTPPTDGSFDLSCKSRG